MEQVFFIFLEIFFLWTFNLRIMIEPIFSSKWINFIVFLFTLGQKSLIPQILGVQKCVLSVFFCVDVFAARKKHKGFRLKAGFWDNIKSG